MTRASLLALLTPVVLGAQCGPTVPDSLEGGWGGQHIGLVVSASGAEVEYDCAHGRITGPLHPGDDGAFTAVGVHGVEHGGPTRVGEPPDEHPALYLGQVRGETMTLTVRLTDTDQTIGTFELKRGASPMVFKCL